MVEGVSQRRLAAIVAMDVAGYSRLMGADEQGTLNTLKAHRDAIAPLVEGHEGRIVGTAGDGLLLEFHSVVEAVTCANKIQSAMAERNQDIPDDKKMLFRIGINLGDVLVEGDDIFGDGVNVAARIEALAEPGGICISRSARDQVRDRMDINLEDMGEVAVKNIARPVRVFRVLGEGEVTGKLTATARPLWQSLCIAAVLALAVIAGGGTWWWSQQPDFEPADQTKFAYKLPDKPSIAVLPFANLSGDTEQEFFADGMTEDLITDLSKVSGLFVVARNSSFAYKGKVVDVRVVAAELGVRYVLKGSIRKLGERVRINAQLIDTRTGGHLWAERYDGLLQDVFKLQDEVGAKVVTALSIKLTRGEADSLKRIHTKNLAAYELFLRARATANPPIPERIKSAYRMFQRVIEMDPNFAGGYAGVSAMLGSRVYWGYGDMSKVNEQAIRMAKKAISVDDTFGWSYIALGRALRNRRQYKEAIEAGREAIARRPNDADTHIDVAVFLGASGEYGAGVEAANQAIRLDPRYFNGPYLNIRGVIQMLAGEYEAALATFQENVDQGGPVATPVLSLSAAAHEGLGRSDEAAKIAGRLRTEFPKFTITNWNFLNLIRDEAVSGRLVELMRAAGVP